MGSADAAPGNARRTAGLAEGNNVENVHGNAARRRLGDCIHHDTWGDCRPGRRRSHLSLVRQLFGARHGWLAKLWFREFQPMSCNSPWCRWHVRSKPVLQPLPAFAAIRTAGTTTVVTT